MKIELTNREIRAAIQKYIGTDLGIPVAGKTVHAEFTNGRGEFGLTAVVSIEVAGDQPAQAVEAKVKPTPTEIPGFTDGTADEADPVEVTEAAEPTPEVADEPVVTVNTNTAKLFGKTA